MPQATLAKPFSMFPYSAYGLGVSAAPSFTGLTAAYDQKALLTAANKLKVLPTAGVATKDARFTPYWCVQWTLFACTMLYHIHCLVFYLPAVCIVRTSLLISALLSLADGPKLVTPFILIKFEAIRHLSYSITSSYSYLLIIIMPSSAPKLCHAISQSQTVQRFELSSHY